MRRGSYPSEWGQVEPQSNQLIINDHPVDDEPPVYWSAFIALGVIVCTVVAMALLFLANTDEPHPYQPVVTPATYNYPPAN